MAATIATSARAAREQVSWSITALYDGDEGEPPTWSAPIASGILGVMLRCGLCGSEMAYIHGHAACVRTGCPMAGVNQAECCSGETACGIEVVPRGPVELSKRREGGDEGAST